MRGALPWATAHISDRYPTPKFATIRASRAGRARTGVDYHIRKLVESANTLSAAQAEELRQLLPSGDAA
jgi:hypothetical protein